METVKTHTDQQEFTKDIVAQLYFLEGGIRHLSILMWIKVYYN